MVGQGVGNGGSGGGDHDAVERGGGGITLAAVAYQTGDVGAAEPLEALLGAGGEFRDLLDGVHMAGEARKDGGLVARAGAHLEDGFVPGQFQRLGHDRHHVRLRDGLPGADGQGLILVGLGHVLGEHEFFPGDFPEGVEHAGIADVAAAQLPLDHLGALGGQLGLRRVHQFGL